MRIEEHNLANRPDLYYITIHDLNVVEAIYFLTMHSVRDQDSDITPQRPPHLGRKDP